MFLETIFVIFIKAGREARVASVKVSCRIDTTINNFNI